MPGVARPVLLALWVALAAGSVAAAPSGDAEYAAWRPLLLRAVADGQADSPADLYKLLHQGVLGPAHAAPSDTAATAWLAQEWREELLPDPHGGNWPLLEPIRPDSLLVRVHLRPLAALATGSEPEIDRQAALEAAWRRLAAAFVATARAWHGDPDQLRRLWTRAAADRALWPAATDASAIAAFTAVVAGADWPAVHHSESFARSRGPHYRVVARDELPAPWLAAAGWPARRAGAAGRGR